MSNEDEDEVEDELERMQRAVNTMPDVPTQPLTQQAVDITNDEIVEGRTMPVVPTSLASQDPGSRQRQKERAKARRVALHA